MRKPVEIIEGEKSLRLNLYIIVALYLLLTILIEPAIDLFLYSVFKEKTTLLIEQINQLKLVVSGIIYTVIGLIPAFYASWFGYRVVASAKLPPVLSSGKTRFPFTVAVVKGKHAKMFGILIITISLIVIIQLFMHLVKSILQ